MGAPAGLRGADLAEQHDEWAEQRRYLGLEALAKAHALGTTNEDREVTAPDLHALSA